MDCPCGSGTSLEACCGRFLNGAELPASAEALMRSRYAAFVLDNVEYILQTHHPETREQIDPEDVGRWARESEWLGLEILETEAGQDGDDEGVVEFMARFRNQRGAQIDHRERSTFKRVDGRWYFYDGVQPAGAPVRRDPDKVGRNDPCPCGSGKKYKKCHGRPGAS